VAKILFLVDLPNGEVFTSVDRADYDQIGRNAKPRVWNGSEWLRVTRIVERKSGASNHKCDSRCLNATGRIMKCECSCGGMNHGKGSSLSCEAA